MFVRRLICNMSFFNNHISDSYGKKCCRYNQNGEPLSEAKAQKIFASASKVLTGWKLAEAGRKLVRKYYAQDYPSALKFIEDIVEIDRSQYLQCPGYKMQHGELLTLELQSPSLKGLSAIDFDLAARISNLNPQSYHLIPIVDQDNYRDEINMFRMKRQAAKIQAMLQQEQKEWKKV